MHAEVETAVKTLAQIVVKAFSGVQKQFEALDKRIELLDKRIEIIEGHIEKIDIRLLHIEARLDTIEHDISDIKKHFVYRDEFEGVLTRLAAVEKKLGLRSR